MSQKNSNISKIIFICLLNIFIIFVILLVFSYLIFLYEVGQRPNDGDFFKFNFKRRSFIQEYQFVKKHVIRPPVGLNYKKKPIIIFGCSFAWGAELSPKQSFSYKLSQYTKRPIYIRAIPGCGIQHMYYQLKTGELNDLIKKSDYIIYVFMSDHPTRLYNNTFGVVLDDVYLTYKNKDGQLVERKPIIADIDGSYIVKEFEKLITQYLIMSDSNKNKNFDFVKLHFEESRKLVKKINPNAKFVILIYMDNGNWFLHTKRWNELEKEGFVVLNTTSLTGKDFSLSKYKIPNDGHPTEAVWDLVVPALAKKLNL